jgi:hypothetical protein
MKIKRGPAGVSGFMINEWSANPLFQVMEISHLFSKQMSVYFNAVRDEPYMLGEFTFLFTLCCIL